MKAVICETLGDPTGLKIKQIDPPGDPAEGQVKVTLKARGVSFVDVLMVAGQYQMKAELPFIPGQEGAGVITQIGAGVTQVTPGDRVMTSHSIGAFVEEVLLPEASVTQISDNMSLAEAASFRANYTTAYLALQRGRLQSNEVLLVHGAAGGVGLAAVHVGKMMGATVIATASSDAKLAVVKEQGADHIINYSDGFRDEVKSLTNDKGADVIYDPVGGDVFDESMRCINRLGRILIIGFTSGRAALAKTNHLLIKEATVIGLTIGAFGRFEPDAARRNFQELMDYATAGKLKPYVSHQLPLDEVATAMQLIQERKVIGKVVLI
ncbi:MAG: NADPH:quinone oxidoreductase family protein [Pseudomonadales bacterium]|jgi:NADPH2:quinone reductase|nr:NADPH:quinone oxidoreductase family protein [Pseudomonadales bacterium]MDP7357644.1 NADPH:quinone oxidoreductase family protein [Pseudomonadales bacterium]MDP7598075.1 NADPH:quinone oxidoreductase family protein [Pseudomonadales bacterium]HJN50810.1 NADPH:quinone oxidoreductase family protein [Pseudomonadales bacterium]|tara:strand:+ start:1535 stop:2503 length:969 start_codon:yes stop_codon:yes gene_type:complete